MKNTKTTLMIIASITIAACSTTKKATTAATSSPPTPIVSTPTSPTPLVLIKPADGLFTPGNEELIAIQAKYKDVTLNKLKEGHSIYTEGACIDCHSPKGIYFIAEAEWKGIIDNMAQKANITEVQKDAVYKYVLSIKATQPK